MTEENQAESEAAEAEPMTAEAQAPAPQVAGGEPIVIDLQPIYSAAANDPELKGSFQDFLAKAIAKLKDPKVIAALLALLSGQQQPSAAATAVDVRPLVHAVATDTELKGAFKDVLAKLVNLLKDPAVLSAIMALVSGLLGGGGLPVNPSGPHGGELIS